MLKKRKQLSKSLRDTFDQHIFTKLKPYIKQGMVVGCYIAMEDEVATKDIIAWCQKQGRCVVPKCFSLGRMQFYPVDETTLFTQSKYGIWEPTGDKFIDPQDIDVMIVPMVGFDEQKHRIGHGAGYYDRYLANTACKKIGIAYEEQRIPLIVTKPHDIDMDIILTQNHRYL